MFKEIFNKIDLWTVRSVSLPGDDKELLLRKKIWWGLALAWSFFGLYDFFMSYAANNKENTLINAIDFIICITLLISFYFHRKKIETYGLVLSLLIIIFPSLKVYFLGGIFSSQGIAFFGLIGPIYALTFAKYKRAILIFIFYLGVILSITILRQIQQNPELLAEYSFRYPLIRFSAALSVIFFVSLVYSLQIAKLKQIEEERLIQLNHTRSKLYTNITHEFRTPLTVILGMASNVEEDPGSFLKKGVKLIKSNAYKLLKLVNQLMNMSKMEAESMPVKMIRSDIVSYLKYIIESFHSVAEEKNIRLHFLKEQDELLTDFDPDIFEDIISNLLSNAIKFTPENGDVYVQCETLSASNGETTEQLIIKVRDNGIGIDEKSLPQVFERFYQADDESTRKSEGTGIGLALVKEYINLIKGTIKAKSKPGQGTEFIISLPLTQDAPLQMLNLKDRKPSEIVSEFSESLPVDLPEDWENFQNGLPHVLIVEDNLDVVEYIQSVLNSDYFTEVAVNGSEGITKALKSVPDIIICDVMMPEKDGYEVCKTLKEDFRTNHIPIIILTAKADQDSKLRGLEKGADAYLIKPFNKKELQVRMQKLIEIRQKLKEKYSDLTFSASDKEKPKGLNEIFLQKVFENLEKNYQEESYTIDQLCVDTSVSRAQMHRKLIALTGKSTSDFIRHFRIKKAKEMLLTPDITISEIAYQVGFKDPNYFTKSFIKEIGITPSQYRIDNSVLQQ